MAAWGKRPTTAREPDLEARNRVDVKAIFTAAIPHGKRRQPGQVAYQARDHLRGGGAKLSSMSPDRDAGQRRTYSPPRAAIRMSQGTCTTAPGAKVQKQTQRNHTATKINQVASDGPALRRGRHHYDPYNGATLIGTSLADRKGSPTRFHRQKSIEVSVRAQASGARPKALGTAPSNVDELVAKRQARDRYAAVPLSSRRVTLHQSASEALTPPWMK